MRCSTVTPGKLATFWRIPVSRLNSVDLPELGGPIMATTAGAAPFDGGGSTDTAGPHPWQSLMFHPHEPGATSVAMPSPAVRRIPIRPRDRRADRRPEPTGPPRCARQAGTPVPSGAGPGRRVNRAVPARRALLDPTPQAMPPVAHSGRAEF